METSRPTKTFREEWPIWRILAGAAFVALWVWSLAKRWRSDSLNVLTVAIGAFIIVFLTTKMVRDWRRLPRSRVEAELRQLPSQTDGERQ